MKNMINYVLEESENFLHKAFNVVDSLILSQVAYLNFGRQVPGISASAKSISIEELANRDSLNELFQRVANTQNNKKLFYALACSPRFRNVQLTYYVNKTDLEMEKQFSAVTYLLEDGTAYIAYRGTDATFVGWKEDFNMAFTSPVPAQEEGTEYLNCVSELISSDLKIGGHSKGGNIAVYSAVKCQDTIKNRITHIFSHDGPGFKYDIFLSPEYLCLKDRINKTVPQSSVIGMLLQHQEIYTIVKSNRVWVMQHDPFSWSVDGCDFCYVQTLRGSTVFMNTMLNEWLGSINDNKRELFINTLYQVVIASGATSFLDLTFERKKKATALIGAFKDIDDETRTFIMQTIKSLFSFTLKNWRDIRSGKSENSTE